MREPSGSKRGSYRWLVHRHSSFPAFPRAALKLRYLGNIGLSLSLFLCQLLCDATPSLHPDRALGNVRAALRDILSSLEERRGDADDLERLCEIQARLGAHAPANLVQRGRRLVRQGNLHKETRTKKLVLRSLGGQGRLPRVRSTHEGRVPCRGIEAPRVGPPKSSFPPVGLSPWL